MHQEPGLGRRPTLAAELTELGQPGLSAARVIAQYRGRWMVGPVDDPMNEHAVLVERLVKARGRVRADPPVTGDWVALDRAGAIAAVLERHGTLVRRAAGTTGEAQVLAANVDLALVVESLPAPNERRAERLVALALAGAVPTALMLTKTDLVRDGQSQATGLARRLGVAEGIAVSATDGPGVGGLRCLLDAGATTALLGRSGVGKSTLVNTLLGEARQSTRPVRAGDGRGRHTTVGRELFTLPGGALILDTPGLREVGLWDLPDAAFADINRLAAACRFGDCRHESEPDCAVRGAVDPKRVAAWRKLAREQAWLEDRRDESRRRKQQASALSRQINSARRERGQR